MNCSFSSPIAPRFGAIIPFIGLHNEAQPFIDKMESKAKELGLNTAWGIGPQEMVEDANGGFGLLNGYVLYTGPDADNYLAFRKAEQESADESTRLIQKQLKELGPPPSQSDGLEDFWRAYDAYEKRTIVWRIFNPDTKLPEAWNFKTRKPDDFYNFQPVKEMEAQFNAGTLDISA